MSYLNIKNIQKITIEISSSEFTLSDLERWYLNCQELHIKRKPPKVIITIYKPNEILLEELEEKGLLRR